MKINKLVLISLISLALSSCTFNINPNPDEGGDEEGGEVTPVDPPTPTPPEPEINYYPLKDIEDYFKIRGIDNPLIPVINIKNEATITDKEVIKTSAYDELLITLSGKHDESIIKEAKKLGFTSKNIKSSEYYIDPSRQVAMHTYYYSYFSHTDIKFSVLKDLDDSEYHIENTGVAIIDDNDSFLTDTESVPLSAYTSETTLDGKTFTRNDVKYEFAKNRASSEPIWYTNDARFFLYNMNSLVISTTYQIKSIVFELYGGDYYQGIFVSDVGETTIDEDRTMITYTGNSNKVTFTASSGRVVITRITISYLHEVSVPPTTIGISSIASIKEMYKDEARTHEGYYLTNNKVKVQVRIIDKILMDDNNPSLKGKIIVCDASGVITITTPPYLANDVSMYIAFSNFACLEIDGFVAFNNGDIEIALDKYTYNSNLNYRYLQVDAREIYQKEIHSTSELFAPFNNDSSSYKLGEIVKFSNISTIGFEQYFYSYVAIDEESNMFVIKDINMMLTEDGITRPSSLGTRWLYDLYGVAIKSNERIVFYPINGEVKEGSANKFDYSKAMELTSTDYFYNHTLTNVDYSSIFKLEGYSSYYGMYKTSFNERYFYESNSYSTGDYLKDVVDKHSLVFSSKRSHLNNSLINFAKNEEEVLERKETKYFYISICETYSDYSVIRIVEL